MNINREDLVAELKKLRDEQITILIQNDNEQVRGKIKQLEYILTTVIPTLK